MSKQTPLTLMDELHARLEARLLANSGRVLPLGESIDPSPELIEQIRKRWQDEQDEEEA